MGGAGAIAVQRVDISRGAASRYGAVDLVSDVEDLIELDVQPRLEGILSRLIRLGFLGHVLRGLGG